MAFRLSYKVVGFCIALALAGCSPYIYYPNAPNISLPYTKHDLKLGGGIGTDGLSFQGSYAIDSHVVILANYAGGDLKSNYFGEVACGYYYPIEGWARFDVLGGFGIGKVSDNELRTIGFSFENYPPQIHYQINNNFKRAMLQADLGFFNKNVEGGFSVKLTSVYMSNAFYEIDTVNHWTGPSKSHFTQIPYQSFFFEPAMFFNVGFKHIKLHFCYGGSTPIGVQAHFWSTSKLSFGYFFTEGIFIDLFQK